MPSSERPDEDFGFTGIWLSNDHRNLEPSSGFHQLVGDARGGGGAAAEEEEEEEDEEEEGLTLVMKLVPVAPFEMVVREAVVLVGAARVTVFVTVMV